MRNHTFLFWVVLGLLVHGVFVAVTDEVKPVSVLKGDSVTLNTDVSELQSDDTIEWIFGDKLIIAKIEEKNKISINVFRDRLELDSQNGSLTIKDITNEHEGLYKVYIKGHYESSKSFNVTVRDVVESLSVMEGDTVTLHTGVIKKQRDDQILWKFGDQVIRTERLNGPDDPIWKNIDQNDQTGEITIRNIRGDQSGDYKVEINTSNMILHIKLNIVVGGAKKKLVMMGESITLHTSVMEIKGYDLVLWKFEDHVMAEINKGADLFLLHDTSGERFNGRLDLDRRTGDLIIRSIQTTDSGVYQLHMISSSHTLQRNISVTVSDPGPHTDYGPLKWILGIVIGIGIVLVAIAAVILYCCMKKKGGSFSEVPTSGSG